MNEPQKYTVNYTDDDTKTWFINSYLHKWVKDNHPEAEKEAERIYNSIKEEYTVDTKQPVRS
tara:strand:+ start:204 stop:389 length:186 start_codon:yes stop_codon:yes gene_type:complete